MTYDRSRCERLARAMASDTIAYMEDTIRQGLEEDTLFELLANNMEENRKAFLARSGAEAAATNILERAVVDTIIVPMGEQAKFPIF